MRLAWSIRKNVDPIKGVHPDGWQRFDWQCRDGIYSTTDGKYRLYKEEKNNIVTYVMYELKGGEKING